MNSRFISGLAIDWQKVAEDSYLRQIPALASLEKMDFRQNVTFLVGENGSGKSTLIEAIAVAYGFNPEGGTINYRFSTYDDVSELGRAVRLIKGYRHPKANYFFRAESFFNLASKAEDYRDGTPKEVFYARYGGKSLHEQSHGESFLNYFQSFREAGLYLMDEPEAALSPQRQLSLLRQIAQMAQAGAQFLIATHSPILLGLPGALIYSLDGDSVHPCDYEETESYRVTALFINNRLDLMRRLMED